MTEIQIEAYEEAVASSRRKHRGDGDLILSLQKVEREDAHRAKGHRNLFLFAVNEMNLTHGEAYAFGALARKALEIPALQSALVEERLSVGKATRITRCLDPQDLPACEAMILFASTHTSREIDEEAVRRNPKPRRRDRIKPIGENQFEFLATIGTRARDKFKRVESLEAQRGRKDLTYENVLEATFDDYLDRRDPVEEAKRAQERAAKLVRQDAPNRPAAKRSKAKKFCVRRKNRAPLTAEQRHAVHLRDQGRCTHVDLHGQRCNSDRWVDIHHIVHCSQGGSNEPSNLATLCSFHHDLVHQLSFGIEGQLNWITPQAKENRT